VSVVGRRHVVVYVAIIGNIVFALWILYNGVDEGFKGTRLEVLSYVALLALLLLNSVLLAGRIGKRK
jgi:hypothetical protein